MKYFFLITLSFFVIISETYSAEVVEMFDSVEDANYRLVKFLNHLTENSLKQEEKTKGFNYRYSNFWYSSFRFEIYIGKFSKKSKESIIRIESSKRGEERVLRSLIETEVLRLPEAESYNYKVNSKSHILTQGLNIFSPALSIAYTSFKSPFYQTSDTVPRIALFLLVDILILGAATVYSDNALKDHKPYEFYRQHPRRGLLDGDVSKPVIALLLIPRIYRMIDGYYDTASQNRVAELSYTIRF
jgi:hypothetical protein